MENGGAHVNIPGIGPRFPHRVASSGGEGGGGGGGGGRNYLQSESTERLTKDIDWAHERLNTAAMPSNIFTCVIRPDASANKHVPTGGRWETRQQGGIKTTHSI